MGRHYTQLSLEERCTIARLREDGQSFAQIASTLGRQPSTVARELKRNSGSTTGYRPAYAQDLTTGRRWSGSRLVRDDALRDQVLGYLGQGWSPEQVSGRLALQQGKQVISHESIYRFIYAQLIRTNNGAWRLYLPRAKFKRGWRARRGGSPARFLKARIPIDQRPESANNRQTPGHWESDLMGFAIQGQNILTAHERTSRFMQVTRQPTKQADPTAKQLIGWLEPLPKKLRQTVTFDNGTEFAEHHQLGAKLKIKTFFCDIHSPWQKGGVENAIGRLRRFLPRKTNLDTLTEAHIQACAQAYNNTPRKCLDFHTPNEAFLHQLLHFKRESTPPLSWGRRWDNSCKQKMH